MDNLKNIIKYSKNLKLLYVEDNKEAREAVLMLLEEFFSDIVIAKDGEEGFEKFESHKIDLIITDINMPRLNGLEMIAKIRDRDKHIPILVLSAYNESDFFIDSIKLGVDGYILKPVDVKQLIGALDKIVLKLQLFDKVRKSSHLLEQYKEITDKSAIISVIDTDGLITYGNEAFCEISQYSKKELIGTSYHSLIHYKQPDEIHLDIWNTIEVEKNIWQGILKFVSRYGNIYYLKTTIKPILDENNNIIEFIALRDDITEVMNPKKLLSDGIKNLKEALVVYIRLEDFATLEEFYNATIVEEIQDKVSIYLEKKMPDDFEFTKVYQLGNGEYAMICEKFTCIEKKNNFYKKLKLYQETIREGSVKSGNVDYNMSILISIAYCKGEVLKSAKLGIRELLRTKQDFIVSNDFAQIEYVNAQKNMETISMIKKAIDECKIVSYFQPIINNKTKKIEKYESLVRLMDNGKVVSPFFFLDISKKGKYYSQITSIVLDNSFNALKHTDMDISINLSALDIEQKLTRDKIFYLLEQNKEKTSRVVFELLEDESIKDLEVIKNFIYAVKGFGVKIAIDDFGAGYSNFERLLDYQPDILKIDACLIKDIETNNYSLSVVETIVAFAKKQNIQTIAEFVENEEIFKIVNSLGVDFSQGYYFGKPELLI